jgi:hypothetical protein
MLMRVSVTSSLSRALQCVRRCVALRFWSGDQTARNHLDHRTSERLFGVPKVLSDISACVAVVLTRPGGLAQEFATLLLRPKRERPRGRKHHSALLHPRGMSAGHDPQTVSADRRWSLVQRQPLTFIPISVTKLESRSSRAPFRKAGLKSGARAMPAGGFAVRTRAVSGSRRTEMDED